MHLSIVTPALPVLDPQGIIGGFTYKVTPSSGAFDKKYLSVVPLLT